MSIEADDKTAHRIRLRISNITDKFRQQPAVPSLDEAYALQVDKDSVDIKGQTGAGVFYAIQSLLSLLEDSPDGRCLPSITVIDAPRMKYRGLMMDVARSFVNKTDLIKIMDVMAMYKLNKLHLHLTDDQGWRIEIPGIPELTQV